MERKQKKIGTEMRSSTAAQNGNLVPTAIPQVTELSVPNVTPAERALATSLGEQLNHTTAFTRENTLKGNGCGISALCRISPLTGFGLSAYIATAKLLSPHVQNGDFLIAACAALDMEGGHLSLRELWRRAGGSSGFASDAQRMIDRLMHAPIACIRMSGGSSSVSAWIVFAKEDGVDYSKLGSLVAAVKMSSGTLTE